MKIFLGITGASGQIYAGRLLRALVEAGNDVTACFSEGAVEVIRGEESGSIKAAGALPRGRVIETFLAAHGVPPGVDLAEPKDMTSSFASGSSLAAAAIVCPCSMNSLASLANGITRNLIHRVGDVMLKEGRPLILVPRETPLSQIHLANMLTLAQAGASVVPAMPAFYQHPRTIDDLADFVTGKVLDLLLIRHELFDRWES